MPIPLVEKYRPKKFDQVKGQNIAISQLKAYFMAFTRGIAKKKAILLYGPAGTGKTTLAHVLANELEHEIFELNASDLRNRAKLEEILKPSTLQRSLFNKGKIILVDEVDGVTGTDRGGLPELIALIDKSKFPIVITANDVWNQKFSLLRKKCDLVPVNGLKTEIVFGILQEVMQKENRIVEISLLNNITLKSKGDLRAAINDLQSILHLGTGEIREEHIGEREREKDIFHALKEIFKLPTDKNIINTFDSVHLELDQINLWLEKNIPKECQGVELAKAFEALSKADIFKGRIYRQQHWRFMAYQNFFLTAGVSSVKKFKNPNSFTKYEKPTRILKIWMANQKNARKKTIAAKYAEYAHMSKKHALKEFFIIALTLNDNKTLNRLQLTDGEKEFLQEYKGTIKVAHGLNRFAI